MEKPKNYNILGAVGIGLMVSGLLAGGIVAASMSGHLDKWLGKEKAENLLSPSKEDAQSAVLPLVSQSPQERLSQLETIASGNKSQDQYRARYLLAADLIEQKQGQAALKWLAGLETDYPILASHILLKRAQAYTAMGDKAKAQATWQEILAQYPNDPVAAHALYNLGSANPENGNHAIAKFPAHPATQTIIKERLQKNPDRLPLLLLIAKHNPDSLETGAIRNTLVEKYASQLKPEDWDAIAWGYWQTMNYAEAAKAYSKATPSPLQAYRVGRGYHLKGKRDQAKLGYQQLITTFPDAKETGLGLRRLASLSPSPEAITYLDKVISKFPDEAAAALIAKADILESLGSATSANQARQSVLTQYPKADATAEYRWKVAQNYAKQGKLAEAWQWAQPITTENPDHSLAPEAGFWVGRWAIQLGREGDGKKAFEHILTKYPSSFYAWRSAHKLGLPVGDYTTLRNLTPEIVKPPLRFIPPAGSDTLKELYQLGQHYDAWALWQVEFTNRFNPTVAQQFTDGLIRQEIGDNLRGINQIWNLSQRDKPEEKQQWQALRREPGYWYGLFPLPYIESAIQFSQQRQLNPCLVMGLIRQESRFERKIESSAGALGLMQVMPATGKWVAEKIQLKDYKLTNPSDNINLGTWYLAHTHEEYNNNTLLAVASYNAGPGNVSSWISKYGFSDADGFIEKIPFAETKGYVESVLENYWNYLRLYNPEINQALSKYR